MAFYRSPSVHTIINPGKNHKDAKTFLNLRNDARGIRLLIPHSLQLEQFRIAAIQSK